MVGNIATGVLARTRDARERIQLYERRGELSYRLDIRAFRGEAYGRLAPPAR